MIGKNKSFNQLSEIIHLIENIEHYLSKEQIYYQSIAASQVPLRACLVNVLRLSANILLSKEILVLNNYSNSLVFEKWKKFNVFLLYLSYLLQSYTANYNWWRQRVVATIRLKDLRYRIKTSQQMSAQAPLLQL